VPKQNDCAGEGQQQCTGLDTGCKAEDLLVNGERWAYKGPLEKLIFWYENLKEGDQARGCVCAKEARLESPPIEGECPAVGRTLISWKRRLHFKARGSLGTNKNLVIDPYFLLQWLFQPFSAQASYSVP
jgi:hypothetical protein